LKMVSLHCMDYPHAGMLATYFRAGVRFFLLNERVFLMGPYTDEQSFFCELLRVIQWGWKATSNPH
jgi:hypothetical protein